MTNVVDSLVVNIGIDPSNFKKGAKEVDETLKKTRDSANKNAKGIGEGFKDIKESIGGVISIAGTMLALFAGGRGFKEFITDINNANSALGRFSSNLGQAPQDVGELNNLVERLGGTAEEAASALEGANKTIQDFLVHGRGVPEAISRMTAQVGGSVDFGHGPMAYLQSLAPILQRMNAVDPARAHAFAQELGIPDSVSNTLVKYGAGLKSAMRENAPLQATNQQIKAAQDLYEEWVKTEQLTRAIGNNIAGWIDPKLESLLKFINFLMGTAEITPGTPQAAIHESLFGKGHTGALDSWLGVKPGAASPPAASSDAHPQGLGAGEAGWWTAERKQHAVDVLMNSAGLSELGAEALVSRWANVEASGGPTSVNSTSGAFGIAQWLGGRKDSIFGDYDFDHQLHYAAKELNTTEKAARDRLNAARNKHQAAIAASGYERAEGWADHPGWDNFVDATEAGMRNVPAVPVGAAGAASLSSIGQQYNATTSSNINTMHIGQLNVNAGHATNGYEIGQNVAPALSLYTFGQFSNTGPE